jgi:CheY-like chemotaxis protein
MERRLRIVREPAEKKCIAMTPQMPLSLADSQTKPVSAARQLIGGGEIPYGKYRRKSFADTAQLLLGLLMVAVLAGAIYLSELDSVYWTNVRITATVQRVLGIRSSGQGGAAVATRLRSVVVVAESDASQRLIAKTTLERYGYAVALADNASQAAALLRQAGPRVALVLLDGEALRNSAGDTIRQLKSIRPSVRILMSRLAGADPVAVSGAAGWLEKPFSAVPLAEAVRSVLAPK